MKTLQNYITEKILINKNSKLAYNYYPKTKDELEDIIKRRIKSEGNECDLNDIDTSNITDMSHLFRYSHFNGDISGWNVSNVTDMEGMFSDCRRLTSLDLSGWITPPNTNMQSMFARCTNLTSLNLSGWLLSSDRIYGMFAGCSSLRTIYMIGCDEFDVAYVENTLKKDGIRDQVTIIT